MPPPCSVCAISAGRTPRTAVGSCSRQPRNTMAISGVSNTASRPSPNFPCELRHERFGVQALIALTEDMPDALLDALLDSWDRNNRILVNLLHALPEGGLEARAM